MNVTFNFEGKNFVVVGASSGIGRQCAVELAESGANILAIGRNLERLQEVQRNFPEKIFVAQLDVTTAKAEDWEKVFDSFISSFDRLHGGIYTAGVWGLTPLNGFDEEFAHKIFDTSFWGAVSFLQMATKKKFTHWMSAFVVMSSFAGSYPSKGLFAYSAAKAAIQAAVESFAKEIIKHGHRINTVSPALVQTEMMNNDFAAMACEMIPKHLLGICEPGDISEMILFLLSDSAKKITGKNFSVDGGYLSGALI